MTPNSDIRMRDVIDAAAEKIEGRYPDDPLVEAAVLRTLSLTYVNLGLLTDPRPHLDRSL